MPVTFADAPSAQRKEQYYIDPREVLVDPALNARHGALDEEHVRALAKAFGRFCAGAITEKQMSNAVRKLCGE